MGGIFSIPTEQVGNPKYQRTTDFLSVSIKLLYGLYRLGTSPILSKQLYGSLQVLHSPELNKAFDHIKPSTADESTNLTSLETDIGLSVQLSYILPLN